ncbi:MAG: helix-turn-helix domain-containing protein [Nitrospira sp.]
MLLTIKELAEQLRIKSSTLYAWAAHGKIPCVRIHGLIRFRPEEIEAWMARFQPIKIKNLPSRSAATDIDRLIAAAKRAVYNPRHGETRPKSSLIGKEECDGAREA